MNFFSSLTTFTNGNQNEDTKPAEQTTHIKFIGSIPAIYDEHLGPFLFRFSAADLARRVSAELSNPSRVLEVACGTGISTEYLLQHFYGGNEIVATDLNDAMLDYAREKRGAFGNVTYQQADAQSLPFEDASFDAVVCQFGVMFFPDKDAALSEFARVLKPGGLLAFNVWDSIEKNRIVGLVQETIESFFETDPSDFLSVPFGYYDTTELTRLVETNGFSNLSIHKVSETITGREAHSIARGLVEGNPGVLQIQERATVSSDVIVDAAESAIEKAYGNVQLGIPLHEIAMIARKA